MPSNGVLGSKQSRPPHHLGGAHKRGATYSSHRAPSTYPWDRAGLGRLRVGGMRCGCASACLSPAALRGKGRVLSRLGWAGVMEGHVEHLVRNFPRVGVFKIEQECG
jgi:hypothetical protein